MKPKYKRNIIIWKFYKKQEIILDEIIIFNLINYYNFFNLLEHFLCSLLSIYNLYQNIKNYGINLQRSISIKSPESLIIYNINIGYLKIRKCSIARIENVICLTCCDVFPQSSSVT